MTQVIDIRGLNPVWEKPLQRYQLELQGAVDYREVQKVHSLDELISAFSAVQKAVPYQSVRLLSLNRLAFKMKFVDEFSAILMYFDADVGVIATVWGSIGLILSLASSAPETFEDILDVLEELSLILPRLQSYDKSLLTNPQVRDVLLEVYSEMVCLYARIIYFLHRNPRDGLIKNAWPTFKSELSRTIMRIQRLSSAVEGEAELSRTRKDEAERGQLLDLLETIKIKQNETPESKRIRYNNIPFPRNPRFSGRGDHLMAIREALNPETQASSLKSIALFGVGGVGKTEIALQYAYECLTMFHLVFWVSAETTVSIGESFRIIAEELGLFQGDEGACDGDTAIKKTKRWLESTSSSCLLIFNDADDLEALRRAWPNTLKGSVLVTTRDFSLASTLTSHCVVIESLNDEDGKKMFLKAIDMDGPDEGHAASIVKTFGGLPLAIAQIGAFIKQRKISLNRFLPLYERNSVKIAAWKPPGIDYKHTISSVWDTSFTKLGESSTHLLGMLSFFDPWTISEDIFLEGSEGIQGELEFLNDEMGLGDASEQLLREGLINRDSQHSRLSIHPLVQSVVFERLSEEHITLYLDSVVHMLTRGFPDHVTKDISPQVATWAHCEKCLPHVNNLIWLIKTRRKYPGDCQQYAKLLLRSGWYLYERGLYPAARGMVQEAITSFNNLSVVEYASATDLHSLLDIRLAQSSNPLNPPQQDPDIQERVREPEEPLLAKSLNLGLASPEIDQLNEAYKTYREAYTAYEEALRGSQKCHMLEAANSMDQDHQLIKENPE